MSLENKITDLAQSIGADIKSIRSDLQVIDWMYYATNIKYTDLNGSTASGKVLTGEIGGDVLYRFISTSKTGLYPTEDSFYSTFDGTSLSELIATR